MLNTLVWIAAIISVFCSIYTATTVHRLSKDVFKHWLDTIKLNQEIIKLNNEILDRLKEEEEQ